MLLHSVSKNIMPKKVLIGLIVGLVGGTALFCVAVSAWVETSNTTLGEWLFPYAIIADPSLFAKQLMIVVLSLIQFPLYGITLGFVSARRRRTLFLFLVILICVHVLAGRVARVARAEYLARGVAPTAVAT
jgi:hypothetical protein